MSLDSKAQMFTFHIHQDIVTDWSKRCAVSVLAADVHLLPFGTDQLISGMWQWHELVQTQSKPENVQTQKPENGTNQYN